MKTLEEAVRAAQKRTVETGTKSGVFKSGETFSVGSAKMRDAGRRVGVTIPVLMKDNKVIAHYKTR